MACCQTGTRTFSKYPWVSLPHYNWQRCTSEMPVALVPQTALLLLAVFTTGVFWRSCCSSEQPHTDRCCPNSACANKSRRSMTMPLHSSRWGWWCLFLTYDGSTWVSAASPWYSFSLSFGLVMDRRERRNSLQSPVSVNDSPRRG